jgi:hypothetical protein
MNPRINELLEHIRVAEQELQKELDTARQNLNYRLINHKIHFEKSVRAHQRRFLLDLMASLYHAVCFPLLRIPKVRRSDYFAYDRHHLAYLNLLEIINCTYCAYGNGLVAYLREIVSRTEQYWCPIKHAQRVHGTHHRYRNFVEYGDAEAYRRELKNLRKIKD